ncbi:MAG: hypothetical protein Q8Q40_01995 [Methylococcaceae bacterium]|nr:hypothetical protein [Methylococcaceae bacterium]MDP3902732.1 hypothetical protein [Methylococcaceae bacterium]
MGELPCRIVKMIISRQKSIKPYLVFREALNKSISLMVRQALKKQLFYAYKINCLQVGNKIKNRLKQRLFYGNAMPPKRGLLCSPRTELLDF